MTRDETTALAWLTERGEAIYTGAGKAESAGGEQAPASRAIWKSLIAQGKVRTERRGESSPLYLVPV